MPDQIQQSLAPFQSSWVALSALSVLVLAALTGWGVALLAMFPQLRINRSRCAFLCEGVLHGVLLFSIAGFIGIYLGVRLHQTFLVGSGLLAAIWLLSLRKAGTRAAFRDRASSCGVDAGLEVWALVLVVVGTLLWSTNSIQGLSPAADGVVLAPWADFFYHARMIGNYAQYLGDLGTLSLSTAGVPPGPYHYGSYMVSALISYWGNVHSIQVATSIYPVLGMLLTGAAIVVLTTVSAGAAGALLAVGVLFFVPDPSFWVPGITKIHSYFFLQQVGVGGAYAVAFMGLSLAYAMRAFQLRSSMLCVVSLGIFAIAGFFKAQILIAYSFFFYLFVIGNADWVSKAWRAAVATLFVAAFIFAVWKLADIPNAPTFTITLQGIEKNIENTTKYFSASHPPPLLILACLPLAAIRLFFVEYGFIFPAATFLAWHFRKDLAVRKPVLLLGVAFFSHACVRLLIANNEGYGDFAEINGKTLVWPYFMVVSCFAVLLWAYISAVPRTGFSKVGKAVLVCMMAGLTAFSISSARKLQSWGTEFTNTRVPLGLMQAAAHIRNHSPKDAIVQLCENDTTNQFATLSERPTYIAKLMINAPPISAVEKERFQFVRSVMQQDSASGAVLLMKRAKISWLLMTPGCAAAWETNWGSFVRFNDYRLYGGPNLAY